MPERIPVDELVASGMVVKTHGIYGKVVVAFENGLIPFKLNDFFFFLFEGMYIPFLPVEIEQLNETQFFYTFYFFDNIDKAKKLAGKVTYHPLSKCKIIDDKAIGPFLTGYALFDQDGNYLGRIASIIRSKQLLFEIHTPNRKIVYLPAVREFILDNERISKKLFIHFPPEWKSLYEQ